MGIELGWLASPPHSHDPYMIPNANVTVPSCELAHTHVLLLHFVLNPQPASRGEVCPL